MRLRHIVPCLLVAAFDCWERDSRHERSETFQRTGKRIKRLRAHRSAQRAVDDCGLNERLNGAKPVTPMDRNPWAFCGCVSLSIHSSTVACPKPITARTPVRLSSGLMQGDGAYRTPTGAGVPDGGHPPPSQTTVRVRDPLATVSRRSGSTRPPVRGRLLGD